MKHEQLELVLSNLEARGKNGIPEGALVALRQLVRRDLTIIVLSSNAIENIAAVAASANENDCASISQTDCKVLLMALGLSKNPGRGHTVDETNAYGPIESADGITPTPEAREVMRLAKAMRERRANASGGQ